MKELLGDWPLWIGFLAALYGLLLAYERWNKARRDRFDWMIEIAARSAKGAGEDALAATERAKLLLGGDWKSAVLKLMRTTWTERPNADDEERMLRFCVEARMQSVDAAKSQQKGA